MSAASPNVVVSLDHRRALRGVAGGGVSLGRDSEVLAVRDVSARESDSGSLEDLRLIAPTDVDSLAFPRRRRARLMPALFLAASCLAHGAVAGVFIFGDPDVLTGAGVGPQALSFDIVSEDELAKLLAGHVAGPGVQAETRPDSPEAAAAGAARAAKPVEPAAEADVPEAIPPDARANVAAPEQPLSQPEMETKAERPPTPAANARSESTSASAVPAPLQTGSIAGGTFDRGDDEARAQAATSGPTPDEIARFDRRVYEALGKAVPRMAGRKGRVQLSFAISQDGVLTGVSVARSSGRVELDAAAMAAVRRARFPAAPAGLSERQRTYGVNIGFE